jgi:MscS family membrane protein
MLTEINAVLDVPFFGVPFRTLLLSGAVVIVAILFKTVLTDLIFAGLRRLTAKTAATWDDNLLAAIQKPAANFILILGFYIAAKILPLDAAANKNADLLFRAASTISIFWALIRATGVGAELLTEYGKRKGLAIATFVPLFRQIVIVLLGIIGGIMIVDNLGYSVSSIIAALGIGGAAIAFASQSTIANLYGSVAIALDRPFKVGDVVKVGTTEGTIESIGLRSTQIRTFTKTLVSIPNNTIATEAIDNYSEMTGRRILATLGLTYDTTQAQIEAIITDIKALLKAQGEALMEDPQLVHLVAFADSSINLELVCFTKSPDIKAFLKLRQDILLGAMQIVAKHGASFAFPTRTLHMVENKA